jgi:hypothetical protein
VPDHTAGDESGQLPASVRPAPVWRLDRKCDAHNTLLCG